MINYNELTPAEAYEQHTHYVIHEFAELCLKYGYDKMQEELSKVLDAKVDRLEPCN